MPNVRKKGKKFVGAWIPDKLYADIKRIAVAKDVSATDIISEPLTEHVTGAGQLRDAPASSAKAQAAVKEVGDVVVAGVHTAPKPLPRPASSTTYVTPRRSKKQKPV